MGVAGMGIAGMKDYRDGDCVMVQPLHAPECHFCAGDSLIWEAETDKIQSALQSDQNNSH